MKWPSHWDRIVPILWKSCRAWRNTRSAKGLLEQIPQKARPGPDPGVKNFAIRICSSILGWRDSFPAKRCHFAGKRTSNFVLVMFFDLCKIGGHAHAS